MKKVKLSIPSWAAIIYILISIGLIPWTIYLGYHLPPKHITNDWDITWVGLDAAIIAALLITGILARFKSIYMVLTATITGTLFLTDAWFDIMGYRAGSYGWIEAFTMALLGEIPLAVMSFTLAISGLRKLYANKE